MPKLNLSDLLARLGLFVRLETAQNEALEDHESRLYALEETLKLKAGAIEKNTKDLQDLRLEVRGKVKINVQA